MMNARKYAEKQARRLLHLYAENDSEEAFAELMNQYAERLGMINTHFRNSHGLPDDDHYTTAADLAKLATALITHHPEHYATYKERYYTFNNIRQANRNTLLWRDSTVDGVKTGHTVSAETAASRNL